MQVIVSYYTASPDKTDNSPCYTADMTFICPAKVNIIANNCLKFGQKVKINNKIYTVHDRMNKKYDCEYFDILVSSKNEAIKLGRQFIVANVLTN